MKIRIKSDEKQMNLALPTRLLFSKTILKLGIRVGRKYAEDSVPDIPPHAVDALCSEIARIKKKYGSWELVNIRSADGEEVEIIL